MDYLIFVASLNLSSNLRWDWFDMLDIRRSRSLH